MLQLSPKVAHGPRQPASRQWENGVIAFMVLKSSRSVVPAGKSWAQVEVHLNEVSAAETVVNPLPLNGCPSISNASVRRRVPDGGTGGTGGCLRAKLIPTVRSRSTVTEHCVPSHPASDHPETTDPSAGSATSTIGGAPALTGLEHSAPH